jgi:CNT family concentrative nucleoside transporter
MQWVVQGFAWVMVRVMRTSGAESLSAADNIFLGQTEAPLLIRPYVAKMTRSELMAIMTGGFVTIAGGVLVAYVGILSPRFPDIAGHLIAASVMGAPAGLVMAKLMLPETEESLTAGTVKLDTERPWSNVIDAAAEGATAGLGLALNVAAMLLAFLGLLALLNAGLGWLGGFVGLPSSRSKASSAGSCNRWLEVMGTPWAEADKVGTLIGIKTGANEFIAYTKMGHDRSRRALEIAPRDRTYAVQGSPTSRRSRSRSAASARWRRAQVGLAELGLRAMIGGSLACFRPPPSRGSSSLARPMRGRPRMKRIGSTTRPAMEAAERIRVSGTAAIAWALSSDRRRVNWRAVVATRSSSCSRC